MDKQLFSMLCICQKAGSVEINDFSVEKSMQQAKAVLVLMPEDAGGAVKKKYDKKCFYYKIPCFIVGKKEDYSKIFNKPNIACIAIVNENLGKKVMQILTNA